MISNQLGLRLKKLVIGQQNKLYNTKKVYIQLKAEVIFELFSN